MSAAARVGPRGARAASTWSGAGRIGSPDEVTRVLAAVTAQGARRARTADMLQVVDRADEIALTVPDGARTLPVPPELDELLSLNCVPVRASMRPALVGVQ